MGGGSFRRRDGKNGWSCGTHLFQGMDSYIPPLLRLGSTRKLHPLNETYDGARPSPSGKFGAYAWIWRCNLPIFVYTLIKNQWVTGPRHGAGVPNRAFQQPLCVASTSHFQLPVVTMPKSSIWPHPWLKKRRRWPAASGTPRANGKDGSRCSRPFELGTSNCRLLVAEPRGKDISRVDSHSQIARFGVRACTRLGRLSDAPLERAIDALRNIRKKLKQHGWARAVHCHRGPAARRRTGAEFIRRVHEETGLTSRLIAAKEEARLATIGCP